MNKSDFPFLDQRSFDKFGLSTRTFNMIRALNGLKSPKNKKEILSLLKGKTERDLSRLNHCGPKMRDELRKWVLKNLDGK